LRQDAGGFEARTEVRALEDRELMPKEKELSVLGAIHAAA
jgi:hypothetical protein